jgi:hypothetical protein
MSVMDFTHCPNIIQPQPYPYLIFIFYRLTILDTGEKKFNFTVFTAAMLSFEPCFLLQIYAKKTTTMAKKTADSNLNDNGLQFPKLPRNFLVKWS